MSGKPVSLHEIAESSGDENVWKSFLERHELHHSVSADRYLRSKLGEHLNAREIRRGVYYINGETKETYELNNLRADGTTP